MKNGTLVLESAVISIEVKDYFSSFFAAFLVTSYMIGVAMKIEA